MKAIHKFLLPLGFFLVVLVSPARAADGIKCTDMQCEFQLSDSSRYADWIVPQGVTTIHISMNGASGGTSADGQAPGKVGLLEGNLSVIAGSKIRFSPGGIGKNADAGGSGGQNPAGGFSGGAGGIADPTDMSAGGGGAASVIFYRDQVIVAAGAGGGSTSQATGGGGGGASGGGAGKFAEGNAIVADSGKNLSGGLVESFIQLPTGTQGSIEVTYEQPVATNTAGSSNSFADSAPEKTIDFAVTAIALITSLSSAWVNSSKDESEIETLENLDADHLGRVDAIYGPGDRLRIWQWSGIDLGIGAIQRLIEFTHSRSIILTRTLTDGAHLRSIFGSLGLAPALFALGIGHGTAVASTSMGQVPALGVAIIIGLGMLDALAGLLGMSALVVMLVFRFHIHSIAHIEFLLAILSLGIIAPLAAAAFRPWRRPKFENVAAIWERVSDFFIIPLIAYLTLISVVSSLPVILRGETSLSQLHNGLGKLIFTTAFIRLCLEEIAIRFFPARMAADHTEELLEAPDNLRARAILIRTFMFAIVISTFIGLTWHILAASLLFALPQIVALKNHTYPNSTKLWQLIPGGIPGLVFMTLLGLAVSSGLSAKFGATGETAKLVFVLAMIPSAVLSGLKSFARHPAEDDVRWYRRSAWTIRYRVAGVILLGVAAELNNVVF